MTDENTPSPAAPTQAANPPAAVASPSPVADSPAAPHSEHSPVVADTAQPVSQETTPAEEVSKPAETVLGADPEIKSPDVKPDEIKSEDTVETKKEEGKQSDEPAPLPTYESFKLPEGVTFESDKLSEFTKELGEFQHRTKADQAQMQEFGQKLVDRHIAEVQNNMKRLTEHYANAWEKQKIEWKESFVKDPEIGGNQQDTTVKSALSAISLAGTVPQQQEFRQLMEKTGIGNHPAMIRTLANLNKEITMLREKYESEDGVKPLPGTKPESTVTSKVAKRYGDTK